MRIFEGLVRIALIVFLLAILIRLAAMAIHD